jgi:hypothetical protein
MLRCDGFGNQTANIIINSIEICKKSREQTRKKRPPQRSGGAGQGDESGREVYCTTAVGSGAPFHTAS